MKREWYVYEYDSNVQGTRRGLDIYRKDPCTIWDSEFKLVERKELNDRLVSKRYTVNHPLLGRGEFRCVSLEDDGCFIEGTPIEWFEWPDLSVTCLA